MSGEAFKLKLAIANLQKQYRLSVPPFTPLAPFPSPRYDVVRQGYASPATIDREFTKFAPGCWQPFKSDIPVLYRHQPDQPAGRLEELRVDDKGLFARVRLSHELAKQAPYFSVCATINDWRIVEAGAQSYGLITSATLDEISLVPDNPGNAQALAQRPPAAVEFYDLVQTGVAKAIEIVEVLKVIFDEDNRRQGGNVQPKSRAAPMLQAMAPGAPMIYGRIPQRPSRSRSDFSKLADALNQREA